MLFHKEWLFKIAVNRNYSESTTDCGNVHKHNNSSLYRNTRKKGSNIFQIMTITDSTDTFVSCFYFYTITLSTVGLGDMAMTEALPYVLIRIFLVFCVGLFHEDMYKHLLT